MIEIDGNYREGGGQILRTGLSLSCLFQKPFRIFNIRKGRQKPGLMPQHLTCVRAAQLISNAEVKGDKQGSTELLFSPGEIKSGDYAFDIGTAGSTSLVLQTLIPAIVFSPAPLPPCKKGKSEGNGDVEGFSKDKTSITLKGGTDVPFSPSYHYLAEVFIPVLNMLGISMHLSIDSYGFYPKGGGRVRAEIFPVKTIKPLRVLERGGLVRLKGYSAAGNLPLSIAERQKNALVEKIYSQKIPPLEKGGGGGFERYPLDIELLNVPTLGQGTFVFLKSESEHATAGFTALGERGKKAEVVGEEAAMEFLDYYSTGAALDPHLADQIVLYLSMCEKESVFTTSRITEHLMTNLWVMQQFHEYRYAVEGEIGAPGVLRINASES
jgi:RNA 3'-terminal phosphate cyclase (ATP)